MKFTPYTRYNSQVTGIDDQLHDNPFYVIHYDEQYLLVLIDIESSDEYVEKASKYTAQELEDRKYAEDEDQGFIDFLDDSLVSYFVTGEGNVETCLSFPIVNIKKA